MKAIIYDTEEHAKQADWNSNHFKGSVTRYTKIVALAQETTLTKAEYATLYGIPATLTDEDGSTTDNPAYTALDASYTLNKYAIVVGNDYDVIGEDGTVTVPSYVVDVSGMLLI